MALTLCLTFYGTIPSLTLTLCSVSLCLLFSLQFACCDRASCFPRARADCCACLTGCCSGGFFIIFRERTVVTYVHSRKRKTYINACNSVDFDVDCPPPAVAFCKCPLSRLEDFLSLLRPRHAADKSYCSFCCVLINRNTPISFFDNRQPLLFLYSSFFGKALRSRFFLSTSAMRHASKATSASQNNLRRAASLCRPLCA